jgi:hypothetical protein
VVYFIGAINGVIWVRAGLETERSGVEYMIIILKILFCLFSFCSCLNQNNLVYNVGAKRTKCDWLKQAAPAQDEKKHF